MKLLKILSIAKTDFCKILGYWKINENDQTQTIRGAGLDVATMNGNFGQYFKKYGKVPRLDQFSFKILHGFWKALWALFKCPIQN